MSRLVLLMCVAACGTDDANVAGDYTIALTNRDNGCNFSMWTVGNTANVAVTMTQASSDVTANVTGGGGLVLDAALGSHTYTGKVSGNGLDLKLFGTKSQNMSNCTYTLNSEITSTISGDVLTGRIEYRAATNGSPDCATISSCLSFQDFNGTRPPK